MQFITRAVFNKVLVRHLDADGSFTDGVLFSDQYTMNYSAGFLHSADNIPSVIDAFGHFEFHHFNKLHRIDGPAVIHDYGRYLEFWHEGVFVKSLNTLTGRTISNPLFEENRASLALQTVKQQELAGASV